MPPRLRETKPAASLEGRAISAASPSPWPPPGAPGEAERLPRPSEAGPGATRAKDAAKFVKLKMPFNTKIPKGKSRPPIS